MMVVQKKLEHNFGVTVAEAVRLWNDVSPSYCCSYCNNKIWFEKSQKNLTVKKFVFVKVPSRNQVSCILFLKSKITTLQNREMILNLAETFILK